MKLKIGELSEDEKNRIKDYCSIFYNCERTCKYFYQCSKIKPFCFYIDLFNKEYKNIEFDFDINQLDPSRNKPPIGLKPLNLIKELRHKEVGEAIIKYINAGLDINLEWIKEWNDFLNRYYYLKPNDIIKEGDEYKNLYGFWKKSSLIGEKAILNKNFIYRRKIK
jgi:hypothetical protein